MPELHKSYKAMAGYEEQVSTKLMKEYIAEISFVDPMTILQNTLSKLLRGSNIETNEVLDERKRIEEFAASMIKAQKELI